MKSQHHSSRKKSPAQLQREIDESLGKSAGLSKHHLDLLARRTPGGGLRAGYLTPAGWYGDPLVIEDRRERLRALREQPAPKFPKDPGRRSHSTRLLHMLSSDQLAALRAFANANGRSWKSKLNAAWSTGRYGDYNGTDEYGGLQQIRNTFGPSWLVKFDFDKPKTHGVKV